MLLILASPLLANDDQLVFSEFAVFSYGTPTFNNGWQDNGWGPRYWTNSPAHSGTNAYCLAPNGGWQAIEFVHDDLDSSLYTSLVLWINGGAAGGQYVGVSGLLGRVEQTRLSIGINNKLPASNTWLQVTLPLSSLGVANKTNFDGIMIWSNSGSTQSVFYVDDISLVAAAPPATVHVSVNATQTVRTVDARLFGINTAAWDGDLDSASTRSVLNDMDNQALRWPGGSWGDIYFMTNEYRGWGSYTTNFIRVATNTHAQVYFIVNYGSGTPQQAADWVRFCNVTNHCAFKYWEVGNECGGSWEADNNTNAPWKPHDPWTYAMRFKDYYTQMTNADPTIKIGAVADITEDGTANYSNHPVVNPRTGVTHNGWTPVMLTVMKTNGVIPDFLIEHKYAPSDGDTGNLLWCSTWAADAAGLRQMLVDYMGASNTNVELACTEHGGGGDRQCVSLVGGLFWADSIGQILQTEFNSRLWWDLRNGQTALSSSDNALYGWRTDSSGDYYSDGGIVTGTANPPNRYPDFYCGKLMKYFARGGDQVVTAGSDYKLLSAYAVQRTNGTLTLLVVNKSSYASLNTAVAIAGYRPLANATVYSYGIPQDEAARTNGTAQAQDIATNTLASAGASFTYTFPPYSATVLALAPAVAPAITSYGRSSNGFTFTFPSELGASYIIQYNSDLTDGGSWTVLDNLAGSGQPLSFTDPSPSGSTGFYRIQVQ